MHILVVGEEAEIAATCEALALCGDSVETVFDWSEGAQRSEGGSFGLVVLVATTAQVDASTLFCKAVRSRRTMTPILVVGDSSNSRATARMLEAGADDCLAVPFDVEELIARVRALIRRSTSAYDYPLRLGSLVLRPGVRQAFIDGESAALTDREFELLACLVGHAGRTVARTEIMDRVWGVEATESNVIDVHIRRLRSKLGKCTKYLETVRGVGYRLLVPRLDESDLDTRPDRSDNRAIAAPAGVLRSCRPLGDAPERMATKLEPPLCTRTACTRASSYSNTPGRTGHSRSLYFSQRIVTHANYSGTRERR